MCRIVKIFFAGLSFLVAAAPMPVWAFAFNININTTGLAGTAATLAFDFIDGDGAVNNTVQVSNFGTDGIFNPVSGVGTVHVIGQLNSSVVMGDLSGFNEFLQPITLGNSFQFQLNTTNAFADGAAVPDSFSFFILDSNSDPLVPLFTTTDPTTANALFALDLSGTNSGNLSVFASTQPNSVTWSVVPVQTVPLPASFGLMLIGGWPVFRCKRGYKNASQTKSG